MAFLVHLSFKNCSDAVQMAVHMAVQMFIMLLKCLQESQVKEAHNGEVITEEESRHSQAAPVKWTDDDPDGDLSLKQAMLPLVPVQVGSRSISSGTFRRTTLERRSKAEKRRNSTAQYRQLAVGCRVGTAVPPSSFEPSFRPLTVI